MGEFQHITRSIVQLSYIYLFLLALAMVIAVEATDTTTTILSSNNGVTKTAFTSQIGSNEFVDGESKQSHSRKKRLVWITEDGRLALPPGTALTFTPTISMPLVRHPPEGFFSNVSISFPLTIDFDKLGLTDESNPLGDLPPIFTRQFGRSTGRVLGDYMARYLHYKSKRDLVAQSKPLNEEYSVYKIKMASENVEKLELPRLPEHFKHAFHGGERVMLYGAVEDLLGTFGINGKACLLRTICEVHSRELNHLGVFGEITKLFLTATNSPFAELIPEYVSAQEIGEGRKAPGECFPYYKDCPRSIFRETQKDKYSESQTGDYYKSEEKDVNEEELHDKLLQFSTAKLSVKSHKKKTLFSM
ncbi:uncharacterized protein LOC105219780 [Zeugodacus cucurbitae]|uniref:Protein raptor homolog n=1 Tax=Zeugodacus cucurbitae TaxID=28588 RepID=A0A0A1X0Z1_ZEUCU|nr:uncharacterized protein LOC105219780 [Zeugodacus cucurbitae]XP_054084899.1 uncharacterized protein LOC105219780 [Zeugodacus cucurbitae]XP_054084900.1 uncharacterized protein LOC105219780 [Zeugodacus cucurbitae]